MTADQTRTPPCGGVRKHGLRAIESSLKRGSSPRHPTARAARSRGPRPSRCSACRSGGVGKLLAELADEDVDDLQFRLVHAAVEMVEEHLLGQRLVPFAQREEFQQHLVLLTGEVNAGGLVTSTVLVSRLTHEVAGVDHRLGMALGAADDRVDARDQFVLAWNTAWSAVIGAEAETADLILDAGEAGKNQNRCLDPSDTSQRDRRTSKPDMSGRFRSSRMIS